MKAIVLLSGGIDSTVMLAMAVREGKECHAITFDYNQRHRVELESAKAIAEYYEVPQITIKIDASTFGNSGLVNNKSIPTNRNAAQINVEGIPNTYVPARNTLFLSYAMAHCEILNAQEIHFGCNNMDFFPYPDCRPQYIEAFQEVLNRATRQAIEGDAPKLRTPLIEWDKQEIIRQGALLEIPFELTFSCYNPHLREHCGICDACMLRREGFKKAGVPDPTCFTVNG